MIPPRKSESSAELSLINEEIGYLPPANYSITEQAKQDADLLALKSAEIVAIVDKDSNAAGGIVVREMRTYCKSVESMRTALTRPLLEGQRLLKSLADEHTAPLLAEIKRIEKMGTAFLEAENNRVLAEQKKQREEFEAAQREQFRLADIARKAAEEGGRLAQFEAKRNLEFAKAETAAIIATPEPEAVRARGQSLKQVLKYEVTDIYALVKARPDLCKIEEKASAINATCHPNMKIDGLRLWFENKSVYSVR